MHEGPYHNHFAQKLPQFIEQSPLDINKELNLENFTAKGATVIFESDPSSTPAEFKDLPREIEGDISTPIPLMKKTHKSTKAQIKRGLILNNSFRKLKKFREY